MKPAEGFQHDSAAARRGSGPPNALCLDSICVVYGAAHKAPGIAAVDGLSLTLGAGEIGCLLGPSGCGKTTVLRAIAGFEALRAGTITIAGTLLSSDLRHVAPEQRGVGMMFQEGALFPHLSAAQNVAFGLRRQAHAQRSARVNQLLEVVGLAELGHRYPHELSGGQQQRIALARALAPSPALVLLDEPFSNLDTRTRQHLTGEVRQILKTTGQAALLVTHDPAEVQAMGDWVGMMAQGRLESWRATGAPLAPLAPLAPGAPDPAARRTG